MSAVGGGGLGLGHAKSCPGKVNPVWVVMNLSTIVMSMDKWGQVVTS